MPNKRIQTKQPHIESAMEIVQREIDLLTEERQAFRSLLRRLHRLDGPSTSGRTHVSAGSEGAVLAVHAESPDTILADLREAYRETVMSVPHYETEYDESLFENLSAEIGRDLAVVVTENELVAPSLLELVVESLSRAKEDREALSQSMRQELNSLERCERELNELEAKAIERGEEISAATPSKEATTIDQELHRHESQCNRVISRRQQRIHNRSTAGLSGVAGESLTEYLYGANETACPVLVDAVDCLKTIRYYRERCLR